MPDREDQTSDQTRARSVEALLAEAGTAHGEYERTELKGVYDEDWPRWYAAYAIDRGIGDQLDRPLTVDELADFFVRTWAEAQRQDSPPDEPWAAWMARRLTAD